MGVCGLTRVCLLQQPGGDEDQKFISSEAVVGTCMDMDKTYLRLQVHSKPETMHPELSSLITQPKLYPLQSES